MVSVVVKGAGKSPVSVTIKVAGKIPRVESSPMAGTSTVAEVTVLVSCKDFVSVQDAPVGVGEPMSVQPEVKSNL